MDTFYDEQSTQEMIIGAGEVIALKMFNIEGSSSTSLVAGKTAKAATIAKAVSLPQTSDAAAQHLHSMRCYHQMQCWLGHTLAATSMAIAERLHAWGSLILPVNPVAPDALLDYGTLA